MSGIPLATVKDNISTKVLTTAASKILYNYKPIFDATSVKNSMRRYMIVIGKTNMDRLPWVAPVKILILRLKNTQDATKVPVVHHN